MASGMTTTGSLADSLNQVVAQARIEREFEGVHKRVTDWNTLEEGTGLNWEEISLGQLSTTAVTENTELNNPQQIADTLLSVTPVVTGIQVRMTDRVYRRLSKKVIAQTGKLAGNAMERTKDQDYLATLDASSNSAPGTGVTLTSGHILAYVRRMTSNANESALGDNIYVVLHGNQIHDLQTELVSVGTYPNPSGMSEEAYRKGFMGSIGGAMVYEDGNITVDSGNDAKGGVHSRMAIIGVQGHTLKSEKKRLPEIGGGADDIFMYDEYAFAERSAGNWLFEVYSNASAPTS